MLQYPWNSNWKYVGGGEDNPQRKPQNTPTIAPVSPMDRFWNDNYAYTHGNQNNESFYSTGTAADKMSGASWQLERSGGETNNYRPQRCRCHRANCKARNVRHATYQQNLKLTSITYPVTMETQSERTLTSLQTVD